MEWSASFYALKRGEGCPMCGDDRPEETEYRARFIAGEVSDAHMQKVGIQRRYSVVIWRGRHVAEPTELSAGEAAANWLELLRVPGGRRCAPRSPATVGMRKRSEPRHVL
jgi:hypothetical protein